MTKKTKLLLLVLWFIICTAFYYTAIKFEFEPIMPIYAASSIILGSAFVLVNGGIRPIIEADNIKSEKVSRKYTEKMKARERYKSTPTELEIEPAKPRINLFKLTSEKQKLYSEILLVLFVPFVVIFMVDYLLILFLPNYQ